MGVAFAEDCLENGAGTGRGQVGAGWRGCSGEQTGLPAAHGYGHCTPLSLLRKTEHRAGPGHRTGKRAGPAQVDTAMVAVSLIPFTKWIDGLLTMITLIGSRHFSQL